MRPKPYTLAYLRRRSGCHFFKKETINFFNTVFESGIIQGPGGVFFVTSEQYFEDYPKLYKVRQYNPVTNRIMTDRHETDCPSTELCHAVARATRRAGTVNAPAAVYACA